jgi:hypothetical protein
MLFTSGTVNQNLQQFLFGLATRSESSSPKALIASWLPDMSYDLKLGFCLMLLMSEIG